MGNAKTYRLFLDVGNSYIKAAYKVDAVDWVDEVKRFSSVKEVADWISGASTFSEFVISGVVSNRVGDLKRVLGESNCTELSVSQIPSDKLDYDTPETLGIDRFLACLGACAMSQKAVVVIDAGTACTVDLMSSSGTFEGGVIMPGLGILKKSLQDHAPALPQVDENIPDIWPGKSTYSSIQWGTTGLFKDTLQAQLGRYEGKTDGFDLYITGGDATTVQSLINKPSKKDKKLVFKGMEAFLKLFLDKG